MQSGKPHFSGSPGMPLGHLLSGTALPTACANAPLALSAPSHLRRGCRAPGRSSGCSVLSRFGSSCQATSLAPAWKYQGEDNSLFRLSSSWVLASVFCPHLLVNPMIGLWARGEMDGDICIYKQAGGLQGGVKLQGGCKTLYYCSLLSKAKLSLSSCLLCFHS